MSRRLLFLIVFVSLMGLAIPNVARAVDPNLVAWYTFEGNYNNSGTRGACFDGEPCGSPAIVYDAVLDSNVLEVNSFIPDYIDINDDPNWDMEGNSLTVSAWIKTPGSEAWPIPWQCIIGQGEGAWRLQVTPGEVASFAWNGLNPEMEIGGTAPVCDDLWHNVVGVYDPNYYGNGSGKMFLYVDGELDGAPDTNGDGSNPDSGYETCIGYNSQDTWILSFHSPFNGRIDDVRVYNRALSESEILAMANVDPGKARSPSPPRGANRQETDIVLKWRPGDYVADTNGHHVYFGTDYNDVRDGNSNVDKGVQDTNKYPETGTLDLNIGTEYFWRIDEVNDACDPCLWPGSVWSFETRNNIVWEDFDQYASSAALEAVWQEQAGTGAAILRQTGFPRFPVVDSGYGMKFTYNNASPKYYSEVKYEVADANKDWTREDIKELDLWFFGNKTNNITTGIFDMYAALEDKDGHIGIVKYGDHGEDINDVILQGHNPTDMGYWESTGYPEYGSNATAYRPWHIRLADFNENGGVNLADVNNFYIGFGDRTNNSVAGGTGVVYFEEFRYFLARCLGGSYSTVGDLTGDCTVDWEDVDEMAADWAVSDYNVATTSPSTSNLIAYYKFEGNYNDSSVNGHHGTAANDVSIVYDADRDSNVLKIPHTGTTKEFVKLGGGKGPNDSNTWADIRGPITVAAWFKIVYNNHNRTDEWLPIITKGEGSWRLQTYDGLGGYWGCTGLTEGEDWGVETTGGTYVNDGKWHHAAGVYDPNADGDGTGKMYLYIDGYLAGSDDASGLIGNGLTAVTIGYNLDDPDSGWFEGNIDEVRIYGRVLSQSEVAYLAGDGVNPLRIKPSSEADIYNDINNAVNFEDFALLAADNWLVEDRLFGD